MIFDLDGTLIDSGLDFDAMRRDMGLPERQPILEGLAEVPPGPRREQCLNVLRDHELAGADRATLFPHVVAMLDDLRQANWPIGILTRNSRESTDRVLARLQLEFDVVLTREDAPPKPDPAGLHMIARRWQIPATEIAFCGDYLFDLQAGAAAGMRTILYWPGSELPQFHTQAQHVIRDFRELTGILFAPARQSAP